MSIAHLTTTVHHTAYPAIDPTNPKISTLGKTVIISGGAGGIGLAIAQGFIAARAARIVILARRQEALNEAITRLNAEAAAEGRKTEVWPFLLDIRDASAVEEVFRTIRARLNHNSNAPTIDADILITNAAVLTQGKTSLHYDTEVYRESFETNVLANMNLVRAFLAPELPSLPELAFDNIPSPAPSTATPGNTHIPANKKCIIDISSTSSYVVIPGQAAYAASKLAFTRIMQALQAEVDLLPSQPIRIHSMHPGAVQTPGVDKILDVVGKDKAELFEWDDKSLPAGFAVWLASPEAVFLKGRFVMANWDVGELVGMKGRYEGDERFGTVTLK